MCIRDRGDRTGPEGKGPMTGRKAGYCAGNDMPGYISSSGMSDAERNRFFGPGGGRRRGSRNIFYATGIPGRLRSGYAKLTNSKEDEERSLREEAELQKNDLDGINKRLDELQKEE